MAAPTLLVMWITAGMMLVEIAAGCLENRPQVLQNLVRLLGYATFDQVAGRRIERNLAGAIHHAVGHDGLRIGTERLGSAICLNGPLAAALLVGICH